MKKVIKLFWSLSIVKIELWLSEMASDGYELIDLNLVRREFIFKKTSPKNVIYRIDYLGKSENDISNTLKFNGWSNVVNKAKWVFLSNENKIHVNPSRENLLRRNKNIRIMLGALGLYCCFYLGVMLVIMPSTLLLGAVGVIEVEGNIELSIVQILFFLAMIIAVYTYYKITKLDKELVHTKEDILITDEDIINEYNLENDFEVIKKFKPGWIYSPDKTTEWLETMELKGYNLEKINKIGLTFYFRKGKSRKVRYIADFKNKTDNMYFEIYKQDSWKLVYNTAGTVFKWFIWSKEYENEVPKMYSDAQEINSQARSVLITHSILYLPIIFISIYTIITDINNLITKRIDSLSGSIVSIVLVIEFSIFYINIFRYYIRTKKRL